MPEVSIQVRMTREAVERLHTLTEDAIQRAIQNTIVRLRELAKIYTPEETGRLLSSFDIASTPRSIVMKWNATSPEGFNYTQVADEGRAGGAQITPKKARALRWVDEAGQVHFAKRVTQGGYTGAYFSEAMRFEAQRILVEELEMQLNLIGGAA